MDNQLFTLSKIFTEKLLRIPDYQRGYAWGDKQLQDFWNDIEQLDNDHNHYTGVLTLENVSKELYSKWDEDLWIIDSKSYQPFFIVDGQQRLTTAIILIQVIIERVELLGKNWLNYTEVRDIKRQFIFDSKDQGISRSYIFGYEKDNPSYEFLKTKIFLEKSSSNLGEETIYTQNLENAKNFFAERVKGLDFQELEDLYKLVTQNLLFNIFTISDSVDVCVAFETMNNRGKQLSILELLKNRLIYLSLKLNAEYSETIKLRKTINDCWKSIYHNLGRNKSKPLSDDEFLQCHYFMYFPQVESNISDRAYLSLFNPFINGDKGFNDLLEKIFITKNLESSASRDKKISIKVIHEYVRSLQDSVEVWYKIFNPKNSGYSEKIILWLERIMRIFFRSRWALWVLQPLILNVFTKESNEEKLLEFLYSLERYIFVNVLLSDFLSYSILESDLGGLYKHINNIKNKEICNEVSKFLNEKTNDVLNKDDFIPKLQELFNQSGFYQWDGIYYFLYEYEFHLANESKTYREKINWSYFVESIKDFETIEHIYPKNPIDQYWKDKFKLNGRSISKKNKYHKILLNSLGNLLALSRRKNSSLQNFPFPEKKSGKCSDSNVGYFNGSYSENEVSKLDEWTPVEILNRGMKLLSFMEKRWGIDFKTDENKIKLLGLDFLKVKN